MQVTGFGNEGSRFVPMQPQGAFHGCHELAPFFGVGECVGVDDPAAPGELAPAGAGEQPGFLHLDASVDEGGRQMLGEVFQVIGKLFSGTSIQVQVVDLIDHHDIGAGIDHDLADRIGDVGDVHTWVDGRQAQKPCELHRQLAGRSFRRCRHVDDGDAAVIAGKACPRA
ncbi:Uncharacterised protein [Mycobacteroides abscessus subsp. abscessus]|nr:Uncharacterised protein [Mycobacteroides abscessus subsp. abscessus]